MIKSKYQKLVEKKIFDYKRDGFARSFWWNNICQSLFQLLQKENNPNAARLAGTLTFKYYGN